MKESKLKIVYILAASHSGSTLLSLLLGLHPDICTVGELKLSSLDDKEHYLCSCGKRIKECLFWKEITQKMKEQGLDFDVTDARTNYSEIESNYSRKLLSPLHRGPIVEMIRDIGLFLSPAWRKHIINVQRRNVALIGSILDVTQKKIIVDSSKVGLRLKYLLRNDALDVKIVRLIRDGRAVALTYVDPANYADAKNPRLRGGGIGGTREGEKKTMLVAAREWLRSNEEAEEIVSRLPRNKWTQVRYEDYCLTPGEEMRRIFNLVGVDPKKWLFPKPKKYEYHIIGNGMRLDWDGKVFLDQRWKRALSERDLEIFDSIAGHMNRKLGYS